MIDPLFRFLAVATVALAAASSGAMSSELRGSFSGFGSGSVGFNPSLNGVAISGTFDITVGSAVVIPGIPSYDYYVVYQNVTTVLAIDVPSLGLIYDYGVSFAAYGTASGSQQTVSFSAERYPGDNYQQATLSLTGTNLLDFDDPAHLIPGAIYFGFASLYERPDAVNVFFSSVTYDTVPVPEPPAILVLLCGCAGLAAVRIRGGSSWGAASHETRLSAEP